MLNLLTQNKKDLYTSGMLVTLGYQANANLTQGEDFVAGTLLSTNQAQALNNANMAMVGGQNSTPMQYNNITNKCVGTKVVGVFTIKQYTHANGTLYTFATTSTLNNAQPEFTPFLINGNSLTKAQFTAMLNLAYLQKHFARGY